MWKFKKFPQSTNSSLIYSAAADCSSTSFQLLLDEETHLRDQSFQWKNIFHLRMNDLRASVNSN